MKTKESEKERKFREIQAAINCYPVQKPTILFYNLNVEIMFGDGKNKAHKKLLIKNNIFFNAPSADVCMFVRM